METPDRVRMQAKLDYSSCVINVYPLEILHADLELGFGWGPGYNTLGLGDFQGLPIPANAHFVTRRCR